MITLQQNRKFGRDKAGYSTQPTQKPKYGDLYLDGSKIQNNKPFPLLQSLRQQLLKQGYTSKRIAIKYHEELRIKL